jgi:hypothetical protein
MLLLYLLRAQREAQQLGEVLGDVRPCNVFLNEEGSARVAGRNSWPAGCTAFELGVEKLPSFVSPEDMDALSKGAMQHCDPLPAEMFAVGLTLLCLANLRDYKCLYHTKQRQLDLQALEAALVELRRNVEYSEVFRGIVLNLCSVLPARRMSLEELWSMMGKHEAKIAAKQPFVVDNAPDKLHAEIGALRDYVVDHPMQFTAPQLLSEVGGSGLIFPEHLDVQQVTPEYVFEETKTIIKSLE